MYDIVFNYWAMTNLRQITLIIEFITISDRHNALLGVSTARVSEFWTNTPLVLDEFDIMLIDLQRFESR